MKFFAASLMAVAAVVLLLGNNEAGEKAKYTIKEVMKKAHTPDGGLLKKIVSGAGTKEDAEQLVECPPRHR